MSVWECYMGLSQPKALAEMAPQWADDIATRLRIISQRQDLCTRKKTATGGDADAKSDPGIQKGAISSMEGREKMLTFPQPTDFRLVVS